MRIHPSVVFRLALLLAGVLLTLRLTWWSSSPPEEPSLPVGPTNTKWIVVTTIQIPTHQVQRLCRLPGWTTVVVGDRKTEEQPWRNQTECLFLSLTDQHALGYRITPLLPENNYGRKNVGYLYAIQHGAQELYETDDDNEPRLAGIVAFDPAHSALARLSGGTLLHVQNPYAYFGRPDIWPRGYPLNAVNRSRVPVHDGCPTDAAPGHGREYAIQQGVVDLDPDVDAIFRMVHAPSVGHVRFRTDIVPVALASDTYCPFNSQNTYWRYKAFWGLVIPVTTTMRVCDIWRSYWVQRVLWALGEELLFLPATADQVRNPHDLHADFMQELDLYTKVDPLMALLQEVPVPDTLFAYVTTIGHAMAQHGFWGELDARIMEAWLADLTNLGYRAPELVHEVPEVDDDRDRGCAPSPFPPGKRVALVIRMYSDPKHIDEFWDLLRSMEIFLPLRHFAQLVVVLDEESPRDHAFGASLFACNLSVPVVVHYEPPNTYYANGHGRQQWSMFWFDRYMDAADLVAIIDTDVLFVTPITADVLFDVQWRPRVKALLDRRADHGFWSQVPKNTQQWIGLPESFRAMSYFPVILRHEDFAHIRDFVTLRTNGDFNSVFTKLGRQQFSQFNIMLNVLFYTREEHYAWHFQPVHANDTSPIPGQTSVAAHDRLVAHYGTLPVVSGVLHVPYVPDHMKKVSPWTFVLEGYCQTPGVDDPEVCAQPSSSGVRDALFEYSMLWTWDTRTLAVQKEHDANVKHVGYVYSAHQRRLVTDKTTALCL